MKSLPTWALDPVKSFFEIGILQLVLPMLMDDRSTPSSTFSLGLADQKLHVVSIHPSPSDLKRVGLRRPTVKLWGRLPLLSLAWKLKALQPN